MGTRSLTVIRDEDGADLVTMYRQYDGYPSGHGQELVEFLTPFQMVNGISMAEERKSANGAGCLAAQIVAHFKEGPGGIYLYPNGTRDCGEEWLYYVQPSGEGEPIQLKVYAGAVAWFGSPGTKEQDMPCLFSGPLADFNAEAIGKLYEGMSIEPTALTEKPKPKPKRNRKPSHHPLLNL